MLGRRVDVECRTLAISFRREPHQRLEGSPRLTLQMVATQMLPRFRGSMASSFIPSSNQPPSVYTARTLEKQGN